MTAPAATPATTPRELNRLESSPPMSGIMIGGPKADMNRKAMSMSLGP